MPIGDHIRRAALARCCIKTIHDRKEPGTEGDTQQCQRGGTTMRFREGAWEWARDIPRRAVLRAVERRG